MFLTIIKKLPSRLFLWVFCITSIYPLIYLFFFSFKDNNEIFFTNPFGFPQVWRFENYAKALKSFNILLYFKNSLFIALIACVFILALSLTFSYAVSRLKWKFSKVAYTYVLSGIFIPIQVLMIPLAILERDLNISGSYLALIFPYIAFNLSFSSLIFYGFFRNIPIEMEEAAYIDGAGIFKTFAQIMLPLVKPAIAAVTTFAFINIWNEYSLSLVLLNNPKLLTLTVGIAKSFAGFLHSDWGPMGAAMIISCIPAFIIYLFFSKTIENSLTVGAGVKG